MKSTYNKYLDHYFLPHNLFLYKFQVKDIIPCAFSSINRLPYNFSGAKIVRIKLHDKKHVSQLTANCVANARDKLIYQQLSKGTTTSTSSILLFFKKVTTSDRSNTSNTIRIISGTRSCKNNG